MIIDHQQLPKDTLTGFIEAFVNREGTDYGDVEAALNQKVAEVQQQLDSREVLIVYDDKSESASIIPRYKVRLTLGGK